MKVAIVGGTRFIGLAVTTAVCRAGHEVLVVHRGRSEPTQLNGIEHLHVDRHQIGDRLRAWQPSFVIDTYAMTGDDARAVVAAAPPGAGFLAISSVDVYRAHGSVHAGVVTDAVPIAESAPLRDSPLPYATGGYEKRDVERVYLDAGAIICRPGAVYGPADPQRREGPVIDRVRRGDDRIPIGSGNFLWSKVFVADVGEGVRLAMERGAAGDVYNLAEFQTVSIVQWFQWILDELDTDAALKRVPNSELPDDLRIAGFIAQHMLIDSTKARAQLGWTQLDPRTALRRTVAWYPASPA